MSEPLIIALPPGLDLGPSCTIQVTALDPVTGATVAGVNVSNVTLEVSQTSGSQADLFLGVELLPLRV